ncbi:EcoRI family type II restriction endonuclease [Gordonia sp. OPL2]|uniref:EcoRI family type II restriction endonuclease n=1 Tax=Gordonia sp. OPL2 TaxID=2486274 RepID=UPI0016559727|nr:EcoRI family type II restriction endonuclease [Gordonia sp. OPL2]RPA20000.1 restriction endonuclease [Gordonia sp. OPL2]
MVRKSQTTRLTTQHLANHGVEGIFGEIAKNHDLTVDQVADLAVKQLGMDFPTLTFRHRMQMTKKEINAKLAQIDADLGQVLFLPNGEIRPDGGLIEVLDDDDEWRVVLVTEAKYQGKDIENIQKGELVGKKKDQDLMAAGNAIERSHKNVREIANFMLGEQHFPYILFLEGSNFLTETISITRPDGREVTLRYDSGSLNRIDRLTAVNYSMPINTNLCENKVVTSKGQAIMLQAASIYTQGKGGPWDEADMLAIMIEVATTSIKVLASDLFHQMVAKPNEEVSDDEGR